MARVDYQQVMVRLRAYIASKPNHGQRDLLAALASMEADALMDEDAYRAFLSRFGEEVEESVLNLLPDPDADLTPPAAASAAVIQGRTHTPLAPQGHDEGAHDARSRRGRAGAVPVA